MRKWVSLVLVAVLCCSCCAALADGVIGSQWLASQLYGWVQLASHAGGYDGYASVDGYGGSDSDDAYYVTVISKNASIWSEPRTNSKKLGSAAHGKSLICCSYDGESIEYENGFFAVDYNGREGWVNADFVVLNDLTITLLESNVPAYIAPDTESKKVGSLSKLTRYRVIGFYDDYYIVNLRDAAAAFIPMSVKHRDNTFDRNYQDDVRICDTTVQDSNVKLRTGPGRSYPEVRTLKTGTRVTVYDVIDGWYMVRDTESGEWAFIAPDSLNIVPDNVGVAPEWPMVSW